MKKLNKVTVALGMAGLLMATGAQAAPVDIKWSSIDTGLNVHLNVPPPTGVEHIRMGVNTLIDSAAGSFIAYCVDPFQHISTAFRTYEKSALNLGHFASSPPVSNAFGGAVRLSNVSELFSYAYTGSLSDNTKAAGFQLALWEVFNDDMNVNTGDVVQVSGTTNASVVAEAQSLLNQLNGNSWTGSANAYQLNVYSNASYQDFISVSAVPEPTMLSSLIAGLTMFGFMGYRRRDIH